MTDRSREDLDRMLEDVLLASEFAWWDWDIKDNKVTCNDLKVSMLGYDPVDFLGAGYEAYTRLLHPDDYERTMQAMRDHLEGRAGIYQVDYRIRRADGAYTWYMDRGAAIARSDSGEPLRLRGMVIDLGSRMLEQTKTEAMMSVARKALPSGSGKDVVRVCAGCRRLKISPVKWVPVGTQFLSIMSKEISHGICPECVRRLYPEISGEILGEASPGNDS